MRYTPKILRGVLNSQIQTMGKRLEEYVKRPGRDFTRPRTLTFETVISLLLTMSENSIGKILIGRFQNEEKTPSASAFVQQRRHGVKFCVSEIRQSQGWRCENRANWGAEALPDQRFRRTGRYARRRRRECRPGCRDILREGVSQQPGRQT